MGAHVCSLRSRGRGKLHGSLGGRTSRACPSPHSCEPHITPRKPLTNKHSSVSLAMASLAFLTSIWGQGVVFTWLLNLAGISALLLWGSIGLISLRFRAAWAAQGRALSDLPYTQPLYPLLPIGVVVLATIMFVAEGYAAVKVEPFNARVRVSHRVLICNLIAFFAEHLGDVYRHRVICGALCGVHRV